MYSYEIYSHLFTSVHSSTSETLSNIIENIWVHEDNQAVETIKENNISEFEADFENDYDIDNGIILSQDEGDHQGIYYLLNVNDDYNLEEFDFD